MTTANDSDDDRNWTDNFTRRRMGLPFLLDNGQTIPQSLVRLATHAIPAIEAERDRAAQAYAVVAAEYTEVKSRHDKAQKRWMDAIAQVAFIRKFQSDMKGTQ